MSATTKHTPTPWLIEARAKNVPVFALFAKGDEHIGKIEGAANAEFLLRAVNAHDKLVESVKLLLWLSGAKDHYKNLEFDQWNIDDQTKARKALNFAQTTLESLSADKARAEGGGK